MITLSLLIIFPSGYSTDTLMLQASGYNNVLQRGFAGSFYFERMFSKELGIALNESSYSSWDSLSKDFSEYYSSNFTINYNPLTWLTLSSGLYGTKNHTVESDGSETNAKLSSYAFLETNASANLLYSDFKIRYGEEKTAPTGPKGGWFMDSVSENEALIKVLTKPCTLSFYHEKEVRSSRSNLGDTVEISLSPLPFLKTGFTSGAYLGRSEARGFSDYNAIGASLWGKDTFSIIPRAKIYLEGSYTLDTLKNNLWEGLSYKEISRNLDALLNYQILTYTNLKLQLSTEGTNHNQLEDYYDFNSAHNSFTATLNHNFSRRPSRARSPGNQITFLSPGSISFSHNISIERIDTPDSLNNLDRDRFNQKTTLSTSFNPWDFLSTNFRFNHSVYKTHYVKSAYSSSSNLKRSSLASLYLSLDMKKYLNITSNASLSFDWTEYYTDSSKNWANRIWYEKMQLTFFPQGWLQPTASVSWNRYENWRMVSGALVQTAVSDEIEQNYGVTYYASRKEEAPRWWYEKSWVQEWLSVSGFAGSRFKLFPTGSQNLAQSSYYAGIYIMIKPWPYLSIDGGVKFVRSDYEAPFETNLSINTTF